MHIHQLEFRNVRGVSSFRLDEIPETGVLVITGENEAGKSTMLEALFTVLYEKHTSTGKKIRALQPVGQDVPVEIEAELTAGPVRFRIRKNYLKSKKAELSVLSPTRASFTGGEAESQLESILAEHLDSKLLRALFVKQGHWESSLAAAGIPSLTQALQTSDGETVMSAPEDSGLLAAVEKEYARYYTATGKPTGELKAARVRHEQAQESLADADRKKTSLDEDVDSFTKDEAALAEATRKLPDAVAEVSERKAQLAAATALQEQFTALNSRLEQAKLVAKDAGRELEGRNQLNASLADLNQEADKLAFEREQLAEEVETHKGNLERVTEGIAVLEDRAQQIRAEIGDRRRELALKKAFLKHRELRELTEAVAEKDDEIRQLRAEMSLRVVDSQSVALAEQLSSSVAVAKAKLEAVSAKLQLSAVEDEEVSINGEPVAVGKDVHEEILHQPTTLIIGAVTATFVPDVSQEKLSGEVSQLQRQLAELFDDLSVGDINELRSRAREDAAKLAEITKSEAERDAIVGATDLREVAEDIVSLERTIDEATEPEADVVELEARLDILDSERESADAELKALRQQLTALQEAAKHVQFSVVQARHDDVSGRIAALSDAIANAEAEKPLVELQQELQAQQAAVSSLEDDVKQLTQELAETDRDEAADLLEGAESRLDTLKRSIEEVKLRQAARRSRIEYAEGVAENLIRAQAHSEAVREALERVERRAAAAELLLVTLRKHLEAARQRYAEPFVAKLNHLARTIFGTDLDFTLDEELGISQRVLNNTPVDLEALSGGAQEQLGLLVRCAVAELVDEQDGVPIIIDDALGHTDQHRLIMMNRVLSNLGKRHQVIVMTSMPERFERVTGKTVRTMAELKAVAGV
ncbi:AAA family ATPase [Corynebacterium epidermidicanis]|uniref:AAA domain n=1 Tax=Corynebacterium epidermidicanis TaxID=1050174 RepID=A0A0G3GTI1_9CORY|nr:AAA family ATPase [Corynebacterium epidermidicanis]AKK02858.1 AAA domain [Corynebacterium epidermidicanis]